MSCPVEGISLADEMEVSRIMLQAGARIMEINAVRRHISQVNGGRLAQRILDRGAELINLILWDIVGDDFVSDLENPARFYGTPAGADNTTIEDARRAIEKYDLGQALPESVVSFIHSGDPENETPKELSGKVTHYILQVPADVAEQTKIVSEQMGLPCCILTTSLEGESREVGVFLSSIVKEIQRFQRPMIPPCIVALGGESTVSVGEKVSGKGGPNQEVALSFANEIRNIPGVCMVALGTDGTDGPTDFAGGIADALTAGAVDQANLPLYESLKNHESYKVLSALKNGVITGNTGTNLCDLILIYISGETAS